LVLLEEQRRRLEAIDAAAVAERLDRALRQLSEVRAGLEARGAGGATGESVRPTVAWRAAQAVDQMCQMLEEWFGYFHGYDPLFTWWAERPYRALEASLRE